MRDGSYPRITSLRITHHASHINLVRIMKHPVVTTILGALLLTPTLTLASPSAPNDPLYSDQWALAQVGATCAWASTVGSADVTVAVVDSGVDMNHPDLVDRLRSDGRDFVDGDNDP